LGAVSDYSPPLSPYQEEEAGYHWPTDKDRVKDKLVQRTRKLGYGGWTSGLMKYDPSHN